MGTCKGALAPYDPRLCYILDGFLAGYGLIITTLYIKEKALKKRRTDDEYKELPIKREDLNVGTRDTYHSLQMKQIPPPSR
ncbi:unnamed protein product [Merluccius merluccius]